MSSLKYIFVIQGNSLVRLPVEAENNEEKIEVVEIEGRSESLTVASSISTPSSKKESQPRNKRNTTNRG